jgi:hypothetical protein
VDGLSAVQFDPSQWTVGLSAIQPGSRPHPAVDAAANLLGMSAGDLRTALNSGQSLSSIAASKGIGQDDLVRAMAGAIEQANPNVSADQATRIATVMATRTRPAGEPPSGVPAASQGTDPGGQAGGATGVGASGGHRHRRHHAMSTAIDATSQLLGTSAADLASALQSGQSLAAVAASKGVSSDDLVSAIATALQQADSGLSADDARNLATRLTTGAPGSGGGAWPAASSAPSSTSSTFDVLA